IEAQQDDVKSFKEKPDEATAKKYLAAQNYFWNSGMFCFKAKVYLQELEKYAPDIYEQSLLAFKHARSENPLRINMEEMRAIRSESIDFAVMEKSTIVKVVPTDMGWND